MTHQLPTPSSPAPATKPEVWHFVFVAEGDGPPTLSRAKRLLKAALRSYGLRCVGYDRLTVKACPHCHRFPQEVSG